MAVGALAPFLAGWGGTCPGAPLVPTPMLVGPDWVFLCMERGLVGPTYVRVPT